MVAFGYRNFEETEPYEWDSGYEDDNRATERRRRYGCME